MKFCKKIAYKSEFFIEILRNINVIFRFSDLYLSMKQ